MINRLLLIYQEGRHLSCRDKYYILILIIIFNGLFTVSCDQEFHPWQENEIYHFSVYGYLDVSADTQWVRVMPVREDLVLEPTPIDYTVTLEHAESGETVVMNDSLFSYANETYAWNFWTTQELIPEHTYRLSARSEDDRVSEATVTLPADFPVPIVLIEYSNSDPPIPEFATVFVEGVNRIADVRTVHGRVDVPHLKDTVRTAENHFRIAIDLSQDLQVLSILNPGVPSVSLISSSSSIYIVSAGPGYHHFGSVNDKVIALPEGVSNIENGIGYLAGFISKTIPLTTCMQVGTDVIIPCDPEPPPW